MLKKLINIGAWCLAYICLCVSFVVVGVAVCAGVPAITTQLSAHTCTDDISPFTKDELVSMADAGRRYTFIDHDKQNLYDNIWNINVQAYEDGRAGKGAVNVTISDAAAQNPEARALCIEHANERYTLTPDAVLHLDDVYYVIEAIRIPMLIVFLLAIASAAHVRVRISRRSFGALLFAAGASILAVFAAAGIWALLDFNNFFTNFHRLFFAEGSWLFSYDSLLICMYPTAFWVGMAVVWFAITIVLSILSLWLGKRFLKR